MSTIKPHISLPPDRIERRLLWLAAGFILLYAIILTLSPAVRLHSWEVAYRWQHWLGVASWGAGFMLLHRRARVRLPDCDPFLIPLMAILSGWGLLTIYRLDIELGLRQTLWLILSVFLILEGLRIPDLLNLLKKYKYVWLVSGLLLTALTFLLGTYPTGIGPRLWLGCCGFYLQPSEPLKILLIIYLTAYLGERLYRSLNLLHLLLPTLLIIGIAALLLIGQRDLGTASLLVILYAVIIYLASNRRRLLGISILLLVLAFFVGYNQFTVIQQRVDSWLNPWVDTTGISYQIVQSLIAMGSGGLVGTGPGLGSPGIVPVAQSDFIYAAIIEEMGFAGGVAILVLFGILIARGLSIALKAPSPYFRHLASGLTLAIGIQALFILGGNVLVLPLTGVTLPLVSYGGSSLVTTGFIFLCLLLVSNEVEEEPALLYNQTPYRLVIGTFYTMLVILALATAWWSVARGPELTLRAENIRWAIDSRFVPRGTILDRSFIPLASSVGIPGNLTRKVTHPPLSLVIGYAHPLYGRAGLEASYDLYLRGLHPATQNDAWYYELFLAQSPPGADLRLSIDLNLQSLADDLLKGHSGALVMLNSKTGEIIVMASHPYFDANQLTESWIEWVNDPQAPFLNRATQGQYPLGTAIGAFILAMSSEYRLTPLDVRNPSFQIDGRRWICATAPGDQPTWGDLIRSGCPGAIAALGNGFSNAQLQELIALFGFDQAPNLPLPVTPVKPPENIESFEEDFLLKPKFSVSPLQAALAVAALNNNGSRPVPWLVTAIRSADQEWVIQENLPANPVSSFRSSFSGALKSLATNEMPLWFAVGNAQTAKGWITWLLVGTLPEWQGTPVALALVLEEDNPSFASQVAMRLMQKLLNQSP